MTIKGKSLAVLAVLMAAGVTTASAADGLKKLPPDYVMPQGDGSPGKVTFSHQSHVDVKAPGCTRCHPRWFSTLNPGATADGKPVSHKAMEQGGQCGACHGKTAFNFDSCDMCHRS